MRFAIFVRQGEERYDAVGRVPDQLRSRTLAVRAFDANAMMVGHELIDGQRVELRSTACSRIPRLLLHVHFASPGCTQHDGARLIQTC